VFWTVGLGTEKVFLFTKFVVGRFVKKFFETFLLREKVNFFLGFRGVSSGNKSLFEGSVLLGEL
jgi:hypothetical protein